MEFSNLFNDEEAILNLRPFQGKNKRIDKIINLYYPKYYLFGEIFHLYKYNTTHTVLLLYKVLNKKLNNLLYGSKKYQLETEGLKINKKTSFRNSKVFEDNIISIKKINLYCKKNNIDLRVIVAPISKIDKETLKQKLVFENLFPGLISWDFSNIKSIDETDFYDITHLNAKGVEKFMNELSKANFFN